MIHMIWMMEMEGFTVTEVYFPERAVKLNSQDANRNRNSIYSYHIY